ncbi:MAG: NAD(P)-dependent oxidoreductase [Bacteroidota bacterium]|nr:NAD(P)-dependent oxidoreductase [Bacteroidota bacterium]
MSKILITGGLGNLGSWLTEYFCENGYEVWALAKNYRKLNTKAKFHVIHADLADFNDIKTKLENLEFDYVIHAGSVNDGFVENYFKLAIEVNTLGTRNLVEYFKNKSLKHFIYFSTFQVYGKYSGNITETTEVMPVNDYGTTHLFAEYIVKQFGITYKLPYSIIRLTNSYGCPKDANTSKWYLVLNDLTKSAYEKKEIVLTSNGQAIRDFIWMGDVCSSVDQLINKNAPNDTFNLSGQQTFKMIEIAKIVQKCYLQKFGKEIPLKFNDKDTNIYPDDLFVSSAKLRNFIDIQTISHFEDECLKIFDLLTKKK